MSGETGSSAWSVTLTCIMGFFLLYMLFGYAAQLMCNIFGFVYPAYASIKALETLKKEDDTKWLTYWVVFAFFSIIEFFSGFILHWFPFYWLLKSMFHLWCFVPIENNGSQIIYQRIIRPWFLGQLDRTVTEFKDAAAKAAADAAAAAMTSALLSDRKQE
ncbi:receptor expression-enhancing protein 5-like isoform X2 [Bacillus rossius redtenbacheri]|uniref:receptor expression-enhancing protein 5-like isoform X2 n=1 Tax=Bacillus rossius redtenbacheri TaxID=93214 RepID=UPI002FDEE6D6